MHIGEARCGGPGGRASAEGRCRSYVETPSSSGEMNGTFGTVGREAITLACGPGRPPGLGLPGALRSVSLPRLPIVSETNEIREQNGEPMPADAGLHQATTSHGFPARSPIGPLPATCSDPANAPEKRKIGGSTPPLTTRSEAH